MHTWIYLYMHEWKEGRKEGGVSHGGESRKRRVRERKDGSGGGQ
jgi:hypothetical protein